jgi:hypothetical protein
VEGQIFANVWHTNRIARISPQTGEIVGWIDLTGLLSSVYRLEPEAVLNGIAYDPVGKRLFVTGKLWPSVFEIRISLKSHAQLHSASVCWPPMARRDFVDAVKNYSSQSSLYP